MREQACISRTLRMADIQSDSNENLCVRIQQGEEYAKELLILQNEGMIHTVAWRERRRYAYLSLELEDLWAAGQIGLLRAANLFRAETGNQFATYAWIHVRQAVQREIMNGGTTIRIPVHLHDRMHKLSVYREPFSVVNYRALAERITEEEADGHGLTEQDVKEYLCQVEPLSTMRSLNEPLTLDGETERQELLADPDESTPDEIAGSRIFLEQCLAQLSVREREVIMMRYGLGGCPEQTLVQVGKRLQITKERVRQLEQRAIKKMRAWSGNGEHRKRR